MEFNYVTQITPGSLDGLTQLVSLYGACMRTH